MTKTLFIYDVEGVILSQQSGQPAPRLPVGVPYIYEEIPHGKRVTGVDVSITPHKLILEDIPLTEVEQLRLDNEMLAKSLIDFKLQYTSVPCQLHQEYPAVVENLIAGGTNPNGTV